MWWSWRLNGSDKEWNLHQICLNSAYPHTAQFQGEVVALFKLNTTRLASDIFFNNFINSGDTDQIFHLKIQSETHQPLS